MKHLLEYFTILMRQNTKTYVQWLSEAQGKEQIFILNMMIAMGED